MAFHVTWFSGTRILWYLVVMKVYVVVFRLDIIRHVATCIYDHLCVMPKQINIVLLFKSKHMCFRVFSLRIYHHLPTCKRQATHKTIFMPLGIDTSGPSGQASETESQAVDLHSLHQGYLDAGGVPLETTQDAGCESSAENYRTTGICGRRTSQIRKFKQQGQKESDEQTRRDETNIGLKLS